MRRNFVSLLALTVGVVTGAVGAEAEEVASPLRETVERHLDSVERRDLQTLIDTITTGKELPLIFPDGEKLDTRRQFVDLHKAWFADDSWRMQMELIDLIETTELGHALVRYRYTTVEGSKAETRENWLALTFAKEEGSWRLVFDQNTPIGQR